MPILDVLTTAAHQGDRRNPGPPAQALQGRPHRRPRPCRNRRPLRQDRESHARQERPGTLQARRRAKSADLRPHALPSQGRRRSHARHVRLRRRLQKDGCDAIIVPCNTAHAFVPYLERHLDIPFINMQIATMEEIKAKLGDKARHRSARHLRHGPDRHLRRQGQGPQPPDVRAR